MIIDDAQLDAWDQLIKGCETGGSWFREIPWLGFHDIVSTKCHPDGQNYGVADEMRPGDAAFVEAAHEAMPLLIAEVRRLRKLIP